MIGKSIYTDRDANSLSELYHINSRINRWNAREYAQRIDTFYEIVRDPASGLRNEGKSYPWAPSVRLPRDFGKNEWTLEEALCRRRTPSKFSDRQITIEQLSSILLCSAGLVENGSFLRSYPSGGALYPLELYVAAFAVRNLESALYHYRVYEHSLSNIGCSCTREQLAGILQAQQLTRASSAVLFISAIFYRTEIKYGQRGYRLVLLEAGHLAQNILLSATAQGFAAVPLGGFLDDEVDRFLGLDGVEESVIYPVLLGTV